VLAAGAGPGSDADPAVQLAALHCLAVALSAPSARAAVEQLQQQQAPEQHATAPHAAAESRTGAVLLPPALQRPCLRGGDSAASTAAEGQQRLHCTRADATTWRAPAASGSTSAALMGPLPASASRPQPPSTLARLLLSAACGERLLLPRSIFIAQLSGSSSALMRWYSASNLQMPVQLSWSLNVHVAFGAQCPSPLSSN
jgi:hypothetical protein